MLSSFRDRFFEWYLLLPLEVVKSQCNSDTRSKKSQGGILGQLINFNGGPPVGGTPIRIIFNHKNTSCLSHFYHPRKINHGSQKENHNAHHQP